MIEASGDRGPIEVYPPVANAEPVRIARSQIKSIEPSAISQMPPGLINTLNPGELKHLLAYLLSRGDRKDRAFRK